MNQIIHSAIYLGGNPNKEYIVEHLPNGGLVKDIYDLRNLKGAIYSNIALNAFIDEELRHEKYEINSGYNRALATLSSGQQKKALLMHLLSKNPDYIIVDNVFDNLDTASQNALADSLTKIAAHTIIIQILNRERDLLPFINGIYTIENNNLVPYKNEAHKVHPFIGNIPEPFLHYQAEQNPLIQFNSVSVSYNEVPVLNNINWKINNGEFWQLIGPNGSGKSTILSLINGDNPKAYGQNLILFGRRKGSGETVWDIKKKIGYFNSAMMQQFDRLDSAENMIVAGFLDSIGLYEQPTDRQWTITHQWLQLLNLYNERKKHFRNFSMAQQRLILIARAMVKHPPLLILDEPTAGLDDASAELFTALVNKIAEESTTAILYVSHRPEKGLAAKLIFELTPAANGSIGNVF